MASDLNEVRLEGNLTQDPSTGYLQSGAAYWRCTVASEGTRYDREKRATITVSTFAYCTAIGYAAEELMASGVGKGDKIRVEGSLENRMTEARDGTKESKTHVEIKLHHVLRRRMASSAPSSSGSGWGEATAAAPGEDPPF